MSEEDYNLHKRPGYADPSPYPEIKVLEKNRYYAELLMDDYAGIISEFTAINQYLYHYFMVKDIDKETAELLENVAIVEMLHLEMLAEVIKLLGGNPIFKSGFNRYGFWKGDFVMYGTNICERLLLNIKSEIAAIENYRHHINLIDDPYIQKILTRIILDEEVHLELFKKEYTRLKCKEY